MATTSAPQNDRAQKPAEKPEKPPMFGLLAPLVIPGFIVTVKLLYEWLSLPDNVYRSEFFDGFAATVRWVISPWGIVILVLAFLLGLWIALSDLPLFIRPRAKNGNDKRPKAPIYEPPAAHKASSHQRPKRSSSGMPRHPNQK